MAADAGIFQQYLQPVKSVAAYRADMDAQEQNALQLAASRMQAQQAQQEFADGQTLRTATMEAAGDQNALVKALNAKGLYKQAQAIQANIQGAEKTAAEIAASKAKAGKDKASAQIEAIKMHRDGLSGVTDLASAQNWVKSGYADQNLAPIFASAGTVEDALARIPDPQANPEGFAAWLGRNSLGSAKYIEVNKPTQTVLNNGSTNQVIQTPGLGGAPQTVMSAPITETANNVANNKRIAAEGAANRAVQMRGQNLVDSRAAKSAEQKTAPKPLPAAALKMQQEGLDAIGTASSINADLGAIEQQIAGGKLSFGPVSNAVSSARNALGMSSEESRNLASFRSNLEKLRNDSLRLNKGVQTDGDAQRAWNELFQNINDTDLVKQRLGEIKRINERAVQLRKMDIDAVRANYGNDPLDVSGYTKQPSTLNGGTSGGSGKSSGKTVNFGDLK